jgi:hypothetical protein
MELPEGVLSSVDGSCISSLAAKDGWNGRGTLIANQFQKTESRIRISVLWRSPASHIQEKPRKSRVQNVAGCMHLL